jgi:hypothetical protein
VNSKKGSQAAERGPDLSGRGARVVPELDAGGGAMAADAIWLGSGGGTLEEEGGREGGGGGEGTRWKGGGRQAGESSSGVWRGGSEEREKCFCGGGEREAMVSL